MGVLSSGAELMMQCVLALYQTFISMHYLSKSLKYPKQGTDTVPILVFSCLLVINIAARLVGSFIPLDLSRYLFCLTIPVVLIFCLYGFYDRMIIRITVAVYYGIMTLIMIRLTDYFLLQPQTYYFASDMSSKYYYAISCVLISHIFCTGLLGGMHFFDHEWKLPLPDLLYLIMNALCIISVLFIISRFHLFSEPVVRIQSIVCMFAFVISLATNPFYNLLVSSISRLKEEEERKTSDALREKYYADVHNEYEEMRELKHDLRNHLHTAEVMMGKGQTEEARQYLIGIEEKVSDGMPASTGVAEIDAAISAKKLDLRKNNIRFDIKLCDLTGMPLSAFEMNSVIMNLVDNAKESLLREKIPQPFVSLSIQRIRGMLMVTCSNLLSEIDPRVNADIIKSSKKEAGHGMGLKIIQGIADKYRGIFTIQLKDGFFHAILSIPWEENKKKEEQ